MEFWEVIETRHSYRDFRPDPVPRESVGRILRAAALAPSPMNSQPWRYHVATGAARSEVGKVVAQTTVHLAEYMEMLGPERYEDAMHWYSSLGDAPLVIGVSMQKPSSEFDNMNKLLSVGASTENLMLAATAEGLATCNITFAWWVKDELAATFAVDDDRQIVSLVAIGYPGSTPPASPPHNEDVAEWLE